MAEENWAGKEKLGNFYRTPAKGSAFLAGALNCKISRLRGSADSCPGPGLRPLSGLPAQQFHMHADQVTRFLPNQRTAAMTKRPLGADDLADFVTHDDVEGLRGRTKKLRGVCRKNTAPPPRPFHGDLVSIGPSVTGTPPALIRRPCPLRCPCRNRFRPRRCAVAP